jgi:hypothetical protein
MQTGEVNIGDSIVKGTEAVDYRKQCEIFINNLFEIGEISKEEKESIFVLARSKMGNGGFWRDLYNYITNHTDMTKTIRDTFLQTISSTKTFQSLNELLRTVCERHNLEFELLHTDSTPEKLIGELDQLIETVNQAQPESLVQNYLSALRNEFKLKLVESQLIITLEHIKSKLQILISK